MDSTLKDHVYDELARGQALNARAIAEKLGYLHSGRIQMALSALIVQRKVAKVAGTDTYRVCPQLDARSKMGFGE